MSDAEPNTDLLAELLRRGAALDDPQKRAAREAFLRRVDRESRAPLFQLPGLMWLAPLAAIAAICAFLAWPAGQLKYEVEGAVIESGHLRAATNASATIRFSDATRVSAAPGSRLQIADIQRSGALVTVEEGSIRADVFHGERSKWRFVAGPFVVQVTGTRFDLTWNVDAERLEVVLHEGSVQIAGSTGAAPVVVRAGQRFLGNARERTLRVEDRRPVEPTAIEAPSDRPTDGARIESSADAGSHAGADQAMTGQPPAADAPRTPPHGPGSTREPTHPSILWTELVTRGEFERIIQEAEGLGTPRCLSACGQSDLWALADAARYTGRRELAAQSLLAIRQRFARSSGARAAFMLGRLYEQEGQHLKARTWYETSVAESPNGDFSCESLAGKMRVVYTLDGKERASVIAREYLERCPQGVHTSLARKLTGSH